MLDISFNLPPSLSPPQSLQTHNTFWHLKVSPELNPIFNDTADVCVSHRTAVSLTHTPPY